MSGGPAYIGELRGMLREFFQPSVFRGDLPLAGILPRMGYAWMKFLLLSAPLLGAVAVVAAAANFMQVNVLFAPQVLSPKFSKLNPMSGFKGIFFSPKTYIELIKNLIKVAVLGYLLYSVIRGAMRDIILTAGMRIEETAALAGRLMTGMLLKAGGAFVILGAADYMIQKKQYMKKMMMSKEDVKQEHKEQEGDPHVKHMRKHLFQQLMHGNIARAVPKATAVVVNPTHYAVALRYDEEAMNAPRVTAKGLDAMALRIIDIARQHGVPVVRNIELAHILYELEEGHDIPEDLYEAVAEVLNFVYQLAAQEEMEAR
jgi:flagellar biosynthetic protein FlhB